MTHVVSAILIRRFRVHNTRNTHRCFATQSLVTWYKNLNFGIKNASVGMLLAKEGRSLILSTNLFRNIDFENQLQLSKPATEQYILTTQMDLLRRRGSV
jgi:hypothetical protein